jgi:hypothetical protein
VSREVEAQVRQVAGALEAMTSEDGTPRPGSVLEYVLLRATSEAEAAVELHRFVRELLGTSAERADEVLERLGGAVELSADTLTGLDEL